MNIVLPLAIESYLQDSGFSASEILVLKKLLEENLLTIRELAAKTGKGIGVIDVAVKKLMRRSIVAKENINEHPRYKIIDPQAIINWANRDLKEKKEMLEQKHQSFAQFMKNMAVEKSYPEIEHFSGKDGLVKAYDSLLEKRTELLTYLDPAIPPNNTNLSDFLTLFARRRQVHAVFQRIIAPNTVEARRFRSRDPFEYRQTVLVPQEDFPLSFEKIIVGDTVACVDSKNMEASFIHFPKLAESERVAFERLWNGQVELDRKHGELPQAIPEPSMAPLGDRMRINSLQKISIFSLVALLGFWITLFFTHTTSGFYSYLYSLLFGLIPLLSGIVALSSIKRWGGFKTSIGKAVFLMGLGIFFYGFGQMIWGYYNFILNMPLPYPSAADFGYLPGAFLYSFGVIYLSDATGAKQGLKSIYAKIFTIIAPIIVLALSYYTFVTIGRGGILIPNGDTPLRIFLDIAYPLSDFLGLTVTVLICGLSFKYMRGRYMFDILSIIVGLAVMFIADFTFMYTTTIGTFYNGSFVDLFYTLGVFLLSFGVLGFCRDKVSGLTLNNRSI